MRARTRVEEDGGQICLSKRREREGERDGDVWPNAGVRCRAEAVYPAVLCFRSSKENNYFSRREREAHGGESMGELFRWSFIF